MTEFLRHGPVLAVLVALFLGCASTGEKPAEESAATESQPAEEPSFWDNFIDDEDEKFDISDFLDKPAGFLPLVIPITEPALGGFGLAGGLAFFHGDPEDPRVITTASGETRPNPPSVTVVGGLATVNNSWGLFAAHLGHWKEDRIRYQGAAGYASINLDFYGKNNADTEFSIFPLSLNFAGLLFYQRLDFRLADSEFFLGADYAFMNIDTTFDTKRIPGVSEIEMDSKSAYADGIFTYDSRDNTWTPRKGYKIHASGGYSAPWLGGDFTYSRFTLRGYGYWPLLSKLFLALRLETSAVGDEAPLYNMPFLLMRGIPAMRYLGDVTVLGETELTWQLASRWSVNGFIGTGRAAASYSDLGSAENPVAGGAGFRYLLAKKLGLWGGIDVAYGPDGGVIYFTVGSAWVR